MKTPTHLSPCPINSTLVCWHTSLDVAAYNVDGHMTLVVDGKAYRDDWAAQFIIDLCHVPISRAKVALATYHAKGKS